MNGGSVDELIDDAWEAQSDAARAKLARRALEADSDALDAYVILALASDASAEKIALLREAVRRGRGLWAEAMKRPSQYDFWLDIDTRPFMRALHNLSLLLWESGERSDAIRNAKQLLRLNPNDNQGIRYLLLAWYPVVGDWVAVERLLKRYKDDCKTEHFYAACLNSFRCGRDARERLAEAMEANPFVPGKLADAARKQPPELGPFVEAGSESEAANYAAENREAWLAVPGAIDWLKLEAMAHE